MDCFNLPARERTEVTTMRLIDADALIEKFNEKTDMVECLVDARTAERFATFCALADAVEEMDENKIGGSKMDIKDGGNNDDESID